MATKTPATARLHADNSFSPGLELSDNFNISLWGEFSARVTIQRSFDNGRTWLDVARFDRPVEAMGFEPEGAIYRFGIKPGEHTSGSVFGRLGQ